MTTIQITTVRENDHYIATIAGGWWLAHGATRDKAVKAVLNAYENRTLTLGEYEPESPIETQLDLFG
jgi:hypothetical protein